MQALAHQEMFECPKVAHVESGGDNAVSLVLFDEVKQAFHTFDLCAHLAGGNRLFFKVVIDDGFERLTVFTD